MGLKEEGRDYWMPGGFTEKALESHAKNEEFGYLGK